MKQIQALEYIQQHSPAYTKLSPLLQELFSCTASLAEHIAIANISGTIGCTGTINIQGEAVQHLDSIADTLFIEHIRNSGIVAGISSEEQTYHLAFEEHNMAEYIVIFDPLDGSSNIEASITIGSIFSIFKRISPKGTPITEKDFLQSGEHCIGAGYMVYGSATILVVSLDSGVQAFTLSQKDGAFYLTHPSICIPECGAIYSVNEGYISSWNTATQELVHSFKHSTTSTGKAYSLRYVGSLVADIHRTLLYGGIFMYPSIYTDNKTIKNKLRLLCEAIPISYIIEQAGGIATNGVIPIHSIVPEILHERTALFVGSTENMLYVETALALEKKT